MSPAEQTLQSIAASPAAVGASYAHLFAAVDALVAVYCEADRSAMSALQASRRTPAAAWSDVQAHVENRIRNLRAVEAAKAAT